MTLEAEATSIASQPSRTTLFIYLSALTAMFMAVLDMNIVVTAMPTIAGELGDVSLLGWVGAAYLLSSAAVAPFYGKLGDMYGRKTIVLVAVALFLLGSLACGLAWSMPALIGARILQGLGGGGLMVSAFAIIGELFEPRERAKYQGYSSAAFTLASVIGPVGGGYLTDLMGWRSVFLINLPIAIAVLAIIALVMPRKSNVRRHTVDYSGGILLAIATVAIVYWSDHLFGGSGADWVNLTLPVLGAAAIAAFIVIERRAAEPIIPLRLFANRTISLVTAISVLLGIGTLGMYFYFALYVQMITGFSPGAVGLLLTPMPIAVSIVSIVAGRAVARSGRYKWMPVAGLALGTVLMPTYLWIGQHTPLPLLLLNFAVFGVVMGLTFQTLLTAIQAAAPPQDIGAATAVITQARTVGASLGLALNGAVMIAGLTSAGQSLPAHVAAAIPQGLPQLAPHIADALPPAIRDAVLTAYASGFTPMYLMLTGVYAAALVLSLFLPNAQLPKRAS
jgi:EmrB/QacA subfamily drug resistance transporter